VIERQLVRRSKHSLHGFQHVYRDNRTIVWQSPFEWVRRLWSRHAVTFVGRLSEHVIHSDEHIFVFSHLCRIVDVILPVEIHNCVRSHTISAPSKSTNYWHSVIQMIYDVFYNFPVSHPKVYQ
jgi:hypothetical protein